MGRRERKSPPPPLVRPPFFELFFFSLSGLGAVGRRGEGGLGTSSSPAVEAEGGVCGEALKASFALPFRPFSLSPGGKDPLTRQ